MPLFWHSRPQKGSKILKTDINYYTMVKNSLGCLYHEKIGSKADIVFEISRVMRYVNFQNKTNAQVPPSGETINKIWNKGINIQKTTTSNTGTFVYVRKHNWDTFKSCMRQKNSETCNFLNFEQILGRDAFLSLSRKLTLWPQLFFA